MVLVSLGYSPEFSLLLLGEEAAPVPERSGGTHLASQLSLRDRKTKTRPVNSLNLQTSAQEALSGGLPSMPAHSRGLSADGDLKS